MLFTRRHLGIPTVLLESPIASHQHRGRRERRARGHVPLKPNFANFALRKVPLPQFLFLSLILFTYQLLGIPSVLLESPIASHQRRDRGQRRARGHASPPSSSTPLSLRVNAAIAANVVLAPRHIKLKSLHLGIPTVLLESPIASHQHRGRRERRARGHVPLKPNFANFPLRQVTLPQFLFMSLILFTYKLLGIPTVLLDSSIASHQRRGHL
ncbi:hypothetical protein B0H11DRAFT_2280960 [Mycena galericulata]|nr:hypothetical protein B0H11DRAFT_2280960 [Mycena galericulata]